MDIMQNKLTKAASVAAIFLMLPMAQALAQSTSASEILNSLKIEKKTTFSKTRSFNAPKNENAVSSADRSFIRSVGGTRAIKVEQRDKLIEIVKKSKLPSINIRIQFAYDSDRIEPQSFDDLNQIALALLDESLENSTIMLNGHTDAAGSREYNQNLSERRAVSVKRYLTGQLQVPSDRLVVAGFGEDRLRDPNDPTSGRNRRVEIINLGN